MTEQQILNQLAQLLHSYRIEDYESAHLEYSCIPDESWDSVTSWYVVNGKNISSPQFNEFAKEAGVLCQRLYQVMKIKNDWRKFELSLIEGKVKVKFNYI